MCNFLRNHRTLQQVICLLVCVCAWRGPVPVLHDHHALTDEGLQDRHAKAFHVGQPIEEIVGLHWHLAFPEDVTGEKCPLRDEATSELSLFACASATASFELQDMSALRLALCASAECVVSRVVIPDAEHQHTFNGPRSFLQTLFTSAPLSALTGVCLV